METSEVIVVGGGVIGRAVAWRLAGVPLSVTCFEDPQSRGQASTAAGAMLGAFGEITSDRTTDADQRELAFRVAAADLYPPWLDALRSASGASIQSGRGTFVIANSVGREDRRCLQRMAECLDAYGRSYEWAEPAHIPHYRPHSAFCAHRALFVRDEGYVNTLDLMSALQRSLEQSGRVRIVSESVEALLTESGAAAGVRTSGGRTFRADAVVLAAGVGIQRIVGESPPAVAAAIPPLMAGKGVSVVVEADASLEHVVRTPNRDFSCGTHVVPRSGRHVYFGATNRIADTPGASDGVTCGEIQNLLYSAIHEIDTGFRTANIVSTAFGSRPIAPDRFPVVGQTSVAGLVVATGTYRNGVLMAPLIADIVVDSILKRPPSFDHGFGPDDPRRRLPASSPEDLIARGVADLVSFIREPNGFLPYGRAQELQDFIQTLLTSALTDAGEVDAVLIEARRLIRARPVPEIIPQLFYRIHERLEEARRRRSDVDQWPSETTRSE
jgi:glycine/D-amino acid oxidase-like deaminating enzyme